MWAATSAPPGRIPIRLICRRAPTGAQSTGVFGGGQIGFNYQIGNFVLGIESDADWTSISNRSGLSAGFQNNLSTPWATTVAGRVGYANGSWLFYGKGGGGWVETKAMLYNAAGGAPRFVRGFREIIHTPGHV
jgi:hypothetical protein